MQIEEIYIQQCLLIKTVFWLVAEKKMTEVSIQVEEVGFLCLFSPWM